MARGQSDGQYVIAFSSFGNSIPQGNPHQPSYPTTHNRADFTLTRARVPNPLPQREVGASVIHNGVGSNYPASYQTYSGRTAYSGEQFSAQQNNNFQSLGRQPQGHQPQDHQLQSHQLQGNQLQSHQSQGNLPQGHQLQGHQLQGNQLQGHQSQGHQSQGHQLQGHQPQGNQSQGHQLQGHQPQGNQPVHVAQTIGPGSPGHYHTLPLHNSPSGHLGSVGIADYNQNVVKFSDYADPTDYHLAENNVTQGHDNISFHHAHDTPSDQSFKTVTLFRTTIPESPNTAEHSMMDNSSSLSEPAAAQTGTSPVPVQEERPLEDMSTAIEEDFDNYETVVINNNHVVSADVHKESSSVQPTKEAETQSSSSALSMEKAVELESVYARPKSLAERKSKVPVAEVLQTAAATGDQEEEVYSQVTKAHSEVTQSAPGSNTAAEEDEEPKSPPPVPLKTDESYLTTAEKVEIQNDQSQTGSAMEDIQRKAAARREEQDYYSSVEVSPGTGLVFNDLDDYATVNVTPDFHLRDRSPESSIHSNDLGSQAARVTIDDDEDDYATVEIATDTMPGPSLQNDHMPSLFGLNIGASAPTGSGDILPGTEMTVPMDKPKLPTKRSKSIDFQLPKVYKIGQTFNVYLHKNDITKLRVDAIVNPANGKLKHGNGVAGAVSKAAGKDFEKDCKKLIKKVRQIPVSGVEVTGSGKLPCKKVIHAVGPNWNDYKDKTQIPILLEQTFSNIFKVCATEGIASVAIPPVSSGQFCVPNDKVATSLHQSILDLIDTLAEQKPPAHIHIVDIRPNFLQSMIEQMNGAILTTRGSTVAIEELSEAEVERDLGMVLLNGVDAKSKQKGTKLSSMSKGKEHSLEIESSGYIDKFGRKQVTRL